LRIGAVLNEHFQGFQKASRDKNRETSRAIKKGDRVMIKYKMTATSIEGKEPAKAKTDSKAKTETSNCRTAPSTRSQQRAALAARCGL